MSTHHPALKGFSSIDDVEQFSNSMLKAMDELNQVIEVETDFVRAGKLVGAAALQPEKTKCAEIYMTMVTRAKAQASLIRAFSPDIAKKLASAQEMFRNTLHKNMQALNTAREVSEDLVKGVAENLSRQEAPTIYGPQASAPKVSSAPSKGIAINQSL